PTGLRQLPIDAVDWRAGKPRTFEFRPPGFKRTYLGVLRPMRLAPASSPFGALVVATPKTEIASGLRRLLQRLGAAAVGGAGAAAPARLVPVPAHHAPGARPLQSDGRDLARPLRRRRSRGAWRRRDRPPRAAV